MRLRVARKVANAPFLNSHRLSTKARAWRKVARRGVDDNNNCYYGHPNVEDPRCFEPDPDGLLDCERDAWIAACEAWDRGERPATVHSEWASGVEGGGWVAHVHWTTWGMGVNHAKPIDWRARAKVLLGAV